MSVASPRNLFRSKGRGRLGLGGTHITVRIPDELLQRLATYGNARELTFADSVRTVIEIGLDHAS